MILVYNIPELKPYINWSYFYFAWQLKQEEEQLRIRREAESFLTEVSSRYKVYACFQIVEAHSEGDDIVLQNGFRIPFLRQQQGNPCYCLSDFVHPSRDCVGVFVTSVDNSMVTDYDKDPYLKMMAQLLADRLAESAAERMHEQVRKDFWGYAKDENLLMEDLHMEHFQGIRPAVGYPSLPDASINFLLDQLLDFRKIGVRLTESGAMIPHASVSGLMISHPDARYFSVGRISEEQLVDYARRRGLPLEITRNFLASNI